MTGDRQAAPRAVPAGQSRKSTRRPSQATPARPPRQGRSLQRAVLHALGEAGPFAAAVPFVAAAAVAAAPFAAGTAGVEPGVEA